MGQSCSRVTFLDPTRPDPAKLWPDPRLPTTSLTRPDPPSGGSGRFLSFLSCQQERYTIVAWFRGKQWKLFLFRSCNVFRGWRGTKFEWSYFSRPWSRGNKKDCKYHELVKCIRGLIWAGLNSEVWTVFILQGSSRPASPARVPDPTQCIRVQLYCFNFISAGNRDLD